MALWPQPRLRARRSSSRPSAALRALSPACLGLVRLPQVHRAARVEGVRDLHRAAARRAASWATSSATLQRRAARSPTSNCGDGSRKGVAIALLIGIALASVLLGIAHLRLREATQKAARLQAEAERERLARQGVQAELKLLQAQVEPHFLFNTLANLRYLVQTGSPDALRDARPPDPLPAHGAARDPRRELDAGARGRARARLPGDHAAAHGRRARASRSTFPREPRAARRSRRSW